MLVQGVKNEFTSSVFHASNIVKQDINDAGGKLNDVVQCASKKDFS